MPFTGVARLGPCFYFVGTGWKLETTIVFNAQLHINQDWLFATYVSKYDIAGGEILLN